MARLTGFGLAMLLCTAAGTYACGDVDPAAAARAAQQQDSLRAAQIPEWARDHFRPSAEIIMDGTHEYVGEVEGVRYAIDSAGTAFFRSSIPGKRANDPQYSSDGYFGSSWVAFCKADAMTDEMECSGSRKAVMYSMTRKERSVYVALRALSGGSDQMLRFDGGRPMTGKWGWEGREADSVFARMARATRVVLRDPSGVDTTFENVGGAQLMWDYMKWMIARDTAKH